MRVRVAVGGFSLAYVLAFSIMASCASSRAPTSGPQPFAPSTLAAISAFEASHGPAEWERVSSLSKDSTPDEIRATYDTSAFQAVDPWLGISTTPVVEQQVFVRSAEAQAVKSDPNN